MLQKLSVFDGVLLITSAIFLAVTIEVSMSEATNETDSLADNKSISSNKTTTDQRVTLGNNTIVLNIAEVGDEEQYRWVDISGAENPSLDIMADTDYTFKISNPTDEEHQLIIDYKAGGKTSEIASSDELKPNSKNYQLNFKTHQVGELKYHCKYHPDMMNGTIKVIQ